MSETCLMPPLPTIPLGMSDWNELRARNFLVVDKTELIPDLVTNYIKVFISKPRRFGKTMLLSILQELFTHGDRNFEGTAIFGRWPEPDNRFPVIRLSFVNIPCDDVEQFEFKLRDALINAYEKAFWATQCEQDWSALIQSCAQLPYHQALNKLSFITDTTRVVFLIDEWDYPLSCYLNDPAKYERIRRVLHTFYNWLRELHRVRFALITGIMRYKETNVFTGKDVIDLSMEPKYTALLGYSQADILQYFADYLDRGAQLLGVSQEELLDELTYFYDGFCFDYNAQVKMYNPWSINSFFHQVKDNTRPIFRNFWIDTAGDSKVIRSFMERAHPQYADIANIFTSNIAIKYDDLGLPRPFSLVDLWPLLTLNGYLSIKGLQEPVAYNPTDRVFICGLTNLEVTLSFTKQFMWYALDNKLIRASFPSNLKASLAQGNIASMCTYLNEVLSDLLPDTLASANEVQYRTIIATAIYFCDYSVREETQNRKGRSDIEVEIIDPKTMSVNHVYVIELKLLPSDQDTPTARTKLLDEAQQQIIDHGYGVNRFTHGKHVTGIALVISALHRQIVAWRKIEPASSTTAGATAAGSIAPNSGVTAPTAIVVEGTVEPLTLLNKPEYPVSDKQ